MTSTILAELSHFGLLEFSGDDAREFLQGQLSCDVKALPPWHAQYGSYNTPQGRMLASFLLWRGKDDACYMQLPHGLCEPVRKRIAMFILRSRVKVIDVSKDWMLLGIAGAGAKAAIEEKIGAVPASVMEISNAANGAILKLGPERFQIIVPASDAARVRASFGNRVEPAGYEAWDLLDIRAGIPFILPETQQQFVPQMANLDLIGGVSFSKGCYPGQEIVARMHYLGKLKQRMYLARIDATESPLAGDRIFGSGLGGQAVGMIVNAAPAPEGGYDALAVMQIESAAAGDAHWKAADGPRLQIRPLPYDVSA
ncbi:MAG TPA: folate-binding protein [Burkholderiales bacterium]|nr:folate-binding protein [Burkholderiales bacterium]